MRIPRIYQSETLSVDAELELDSAASQYLLKVLRLRPGAHLEVFDGKANAYEAELTDSAKRARIKLLKRIDTNTESPLQLHVGLGISKGERMDFAIQKLVETGVCAITPLLTEFTVVKLDSKRAQTRQQHWQGIMASACEQCGRTVLPQLHDVSPIAKWLETTQAECKLVFDASGKMTLRDIQPAPASVNVLIGPEGGLSETEIHLAAQLGFQVTRLGPRILRTETAAVAISASLQTLWGDYGR